MATQLSQSSHTQLSSHQSPFSLKLAKSTQNIKRNFKRNDKITLILDDSSNSLSSTSSLSSESEEEEEFINDNPLTHREYNKFDMISDPSWVRDEREEEDRKRIEQNIKNRKDRNKKTNNKATSPSQGNTDSLTDNNVYSNLAIPRKISPASAVKKHKIDKTTKERRSLDIKSNTNQKINFDENTTKLKNDSLPLGQRTDSLSADAQLEHCTISCVDESCDNVSNKLNKCQKSESVILESRSHWARIKGTKKRFTRSINLWTSGNKKDTVASTQYEITQSSKSLPIPTSRPKRMHRRTTSELGLKKNSNNRTDRIKPKKRDTKKRKRKVTEKVQEQENAEEQEKEQEKENVELDYVPQNLGSNKVVRKAVADS